MDSLYYHYTSADVLLKLLEPVLSGSDEIVFHASEISCMNDVLENKIVAEELFSQSRDVKARLKKAREDFNCSCFVLSLGMNCHESIPMWSMYGDDFAGVCLQFHRLDKRVKYGNSKGCIPDEKQLIECEYKPQDNIRKIASELRKLFGESSDTKAAYQKLLLASCALKTLPFKYENECRYVLFTNKFKFKSSRYGIVRYVDMPLPLSSLKKIYVGPLASDVTEQSIRQIVTRINQDKGMNIKFVRSNLKIR